MQRRTVLAGLAVGLAGCMDTLEGPDAAEAETLIRESINDERETAGVAPVGSKKSLVEAARDHSRDMCERDFYGHQNPDGEEPWDRVGCRASENIHRGELGTMEDASGESYQTLVTEELARYVSEGWIGSPDHYENMVDGQWRSIGVGVYVGDDQFFATAMFC